MSMSSTSTITNISSGHKTTHLNHTTHRISNGAQACAACKYQRRKCAPDCILAPYFPHDRQKQFLNAHKLFGVSNITKIIRGLTPQQKDNAMRTIIFQSDMRAKDPVGGCYRMIQILQHQIECHRAEMEFILQQIAMWKAHQTAAYQQQQMQISGDHDHDGKNNNDDPTTSSYEILQEFNDHQNYQAMPIQDKKEYVNVQQHEQQIKQQLHENNDDGGGEVLNHHPLQHHFQDFQHSWSLQDSVWIPTKEEGSPVEGDHDPSREVRSQTDHSVNLGHEFVEITSFDRGDSFKFDPEQALEKRIELEIADRCSEMMLKAEDLALEDEAAAFQQHQIQEHDLRGAATLFTLTS